MGVTTMPNKSLSQSEDRIARPGCIFPLKEKAIVVEILKSKNSEHNGKYSFHFEIWPSNPDFLLGNNNGSH